ncbi:MAG: hypothetical protein IH919_07815, partial [Deltaproteobacteria bacterium]|nr:hypothetical protein [Deltaproteobacteria bacterium]
ISPRVVLQVVDLAGKSGMGTQIPLDQQDLKGAKKASLESWVVKLPGWSPAWDHYQISVIHLRPIDGEYPAILDYPEAEYEVMLFALDPEKTPDALDIQTLIPLTPFNYVHQFHGVVDDQAKLVCTALVSDLVDGRLMPELLGIHGANDLWNSRVQLAIDYAKVTCEG